MPLIKKVCIIILENRDDALMNNRKILFLCILFISLLTLPLFVFASIDENTQTSKWEVEAISNAKDLCMAEENKNVPSELSNGTSGYYLYCIEISCLNNLNVHTIEKPLKDVLKCANGNILPKTLISSSGLTDLELKVGASCSNNGIYAYAIEKVYYDCSKNIDDTPYVPTTLTSTTLIEDVTMVKSPETGVEDYFLVLGITTTILMVGLYIIDKKNIFKKI